MLNREFRVNQPFECSKALHSSHLFHAYDTDILLAGDNLFLICAKVSIKRYTSALCLPVEVGMIAKVIYVDCSPVYIGESRRCFWLLPTSVGKSRFSLLWRLYL